MKCPSLFSVLTFCVGDTLYHIVPGKNLSLTLRIFFTGTRRRFSGGNSWKQCGIIFAVVFGSNGIAYCAAAVLALSPLVRGQ